MDNFSFLVLRTVHSRRVLSLAELETTLKRDPVDPVLFLHQKGFLHIFSNYPTKDVEKALLFDSHRQITITITFEGCAALEAEIKERKQIRYNEFRAWVTLFVAIIALVLSIKASL